MPDARILTETRNADIGLLRIDPWVRFDSPFVTAMPICIDGLFAETLPRLDTKAVHVDGFESLGSINADGTKKCVTDGQVRFTRI